MEKQQHGAGKLLPCLDREGPLSMQPWGSCPRGRAGRVKMGRMDPCTGLRSPHVQRRAVGDAGDSAGAQGDMCFWDALLRRRAWSSKSLGG